jgi:hypothetical protein
LEGHAEAFRALAGTPMLHILCDNVKSAVSRVLFGRNRLESHRWVLFRSTFGSTPSTASLGWAVLTRRVEWKADVSGAHLVPVPEGRDVGRAEHPVGEV